MKKHLLLPLLFLLPAWPLQAQYATETTLQGHLQYTVQGFQQQLAKMVDSIDQLKKANDLLGQTRQLTSDMKEIMGLPQEAMSQVGQVSGLGNIQGAGQSLRQLAQAASGQAALTSTGNGLYKLIPSSIQGVQVERDTEGYKKFDAFDKTYDAYAQASEDIAKKIDGLNRQLVQAQNQPAQTEAEQREKQAKIASLQGQIQSLQTKQQQMAADVAAQKAANDQDKEKQDQARTEELNEIHSRGIKNFNDPLAGR
jgi:hypothetical protein